MMTKNIVNCIGAALALCVVLLSGSCGPIAGPILPRDVPPQVSPSATAGCVGSNLANPATTYCILMGYSTQTVETAQGQQGVCVFPDGSNCDEWAFLNGSCGQQYSYCAKQGYGIQTARSAGNSYSQESAVCTDSSGKVIGKVAELSGLQERLLCGAKP